MISIWFIWINSGSVNPSLPWANSVLIGQLVMPTLIDWFFHVYSVSETKCPFNSICIERAGRDFANVLVWSCLGRPVEGWKLKKTKQTKKKPHYPFLVTLQWTWGHVFTPSLPWYLTFVIQPNGNKVLSVVIWKISTTQK